ncbi:fibrobacter succinogenes major paralogous domain-containing protein, partial [Candidatus Saccharibacteria bacterium]|nr:fibrobacter succinogenes major paralogous domain-containing protein [Candidatus Saccharibacteria bacterium]
MKAIHQTNTKQILKEARIFLPLLATTLLTIASASILSSHTSTALDQKSISASVKVSDSCSMQISDDGKATLDNPYEMIGGTYDDNVKNVNISMSCNDRNGFSLYAVGFSNNEIGNTNLISTANGNIPTGLDTTTLNSNWAFKFTPVTTSSYVPTIVSDSEGSFASFHKIPSTNTKVATFTDAVEVTGSSSVTATYAVGVSPYQAPDTYTGQVKFTLVHPNFADSEQRVYMQDLTPSMIADLLPNVGNTFVAYDKRDNQSYKIAKLADGKYWMVENLNLAGGTTVTPADSNVTESYTLPASATKNTDNNDLTDSTQFSDNTTAYVFNSGNKTNCGASGQNIPCGSYYSYVAATAGTGASLTDDGVNASGSICPKGWRLPTATTSNAPAFMYGNWKTGDFYALATAYGANLESHYIASTTSFNDNAGPGTMPSFLFGGFYLNAAFSNSGAHGYYWSSTSNSTPAAYALNFTQSSVDITLGLGRLYGFSVRCLFETRDITDISTMQEISPAIAANT